VETFFKGKKDIGIKLKLMANLFQCHNARLQEPKMIADKCEMIFGRENDEDEDVECDQVAIGVSEDEVLVCERCAIMLEDGGVKITYYGDDC
jgi:ribonuclease BN (tRNA processing enzyme)